MLIKRSQKKNYERNRFCGQNSIWGSYRDWLLNLYLKNNTGRNHRHLFVQKIRGNTLSPFDPFSETCDFSQIQWIKSQKWLTRTDSPAYHCVVLSFSYWIVLKVLAAIQFRSRGEWRKLPHLAISPAFLHREVQKDCQNRKREIGYMPLEDCPFLKTAYFQSLFSMWLWF